MTKELYQAILAAKRTFKTINFDMAVDAGSKKYEYATYNQVIDAIQESLDQNGLLIMHDCDDESPEMRIETVRKSLYKNTPIVEVSAVFQLLKVKTRIIHAETGQEASITIPYWFDMAQNGLQSLGGAFTYLKRYGITTILGLQAEKDVDANDQNDQVDNRHIQSIKNRAQPHITPQNENAIVVTQEFYLNKIQPVLLKNPNKAVAIQWMQQQISKRKDLQFTPEIKQQAFSAINKHYDKIQNTTTEKPKEPHGFNEQKPAWIDVCLADFSASKTVNQLLDTRAYYENDIVKLNKNSPIFQDILAKFNAAMQHLKEAEKPAQQDNVIPFNREKQVINDDPRGWENDPVFNSYGNRG